MKLSIIIPIYNVAPYLHECLDSVLAAAKTLREKSEVRSEKCEAVEVICVDDGSTDGSGEILDEYTEVSEMWKVNSATTHHTLLTAHFVVLHQPNAGVSAARNAALDIATGDWVLFVDADDVIAPCALTHIAEAIRWSPRADVIAFRTLKFCEGETPALTTESSQLVLGQKIDSRMQLDTKNAMSNFAEKAYRRSIVGDIRFSPYTVGEDQLFLLKVFLMSSFTQEIESNLYGYRQRATSAVHTAITPGKISDMICYNFDELSAIENTTKTVAPSFLHITLNWLTEGVAYRLLSLTASDQKDALWQLWREHLRKVSGLVKVRGFQKFRVWLFSLLPVPAFAWVLFYLPAWLKLKGLHR